MANDGSRGQGSLTMKAVLEAAAESLDLDGSSAKKSGSTKSISDAPAARIDDSPSPSIGLAAAKVSWRWNQRRNNREILLEIGMPPG